MIVDLRKFKTAVDVAGEIIPVNRQVLQDHVPMALVVTFGQHLDLTGHNLYTFGVIVTETDVVQNLDNSLLDLVTKKVVSSVGRIHAGIDIRICVLIHSCRFWAKASSLVSKASSVERQSQADWLLVGQRGWRLRTTVPGNLVRMCPAER